MLLRYKVLSRSFDSRGIVISLGICLYWNKFIRKYGNRLYFRNREAILIKGGNVMKSYEVYWKDLSEEAQERLKEIANFDIKRQKQQ